MPLNGKYLDLNGLGYLWSKLKSKFATAAQGSKADTALQQSDITSTYSASGTAPVNGTAVAAALGSLDVASVGGTGKVISAISETDGKISATATTMDTTPTTNSTNPVTSGGVAASQAEQDAEIAVIANAGAKNFADFNFGGVVQNANVKPGTIVCIDSNGTFSFSGTSDDKNYAAYVLKQFLLKAGTYKISGVSGGSNTTYWMRIGTGTTDTGLFNLYDAEREFDIASDTLITVQVVIFANQTVSNLVFKPMIRPASITDSTFVPYALPNPVLTPALIEQVDGEAKNRALETDKTGTRYFSIDVRPITGTYRFVIGQYTSTDTDTNNFIIIFYYSDGTNETRYYHKDADINYEYTTNKYLNKIRVYASVDYSKSDGDTVSVSNLMICTSADYAISPAFVPYAKTNRELTVTENEDRAALVALVDGGAKNLVNAPSGSGIRFINIPIVLQPGDYYVKFQNITSTDTDASVCQFGAFAEDNSQASGLPQLKREDNTGAMFTVTKQTSYVRLYASSSYAGCEGDTVTFTGCMICTAADYAISTKFVSYLKPYSEIGRLGYYIEEIMLSGVTFTKAGGGMFYSSAIDVSDKFDLLLGATLNGFGYLQSNVAIMPSIKPTNKTYSLCICDSTNPQTLPVAANSYVDVTLYGIVKG